LGIHLEGLRKTDKFQSQCSVMEPSSIPEIDGLRNLLGLSVLDAGPCPRVYANFAPSLCKA
jgi:hypothetical protein